MKGFHHNEVGATLKYKNYYWNYHLIIKFEIGMKGKSSKTLSNGKSSVKKRLDQQLISNFFHEVYLKTKLCKVCLMFISKFLHT